MKQHTLLSFIGMERCDIVYHYLKVLEKTGNEIVVVDNSECKDFFGMLRKENECDVAETGPTPVVCNVTYSPEFFAQFDVAIVYHGMTKDEEILNHSDFIYLCTDYCESSLRTINHLMEDISIPVTMIYRDKVTKKISERTVDHSIHVNVTNRYILPFYNSDYASYITLSHNGIQSRKELSQEFREMLIDMIVNTTDLDQKNARKLLK